MKKLIFLLLIIVTTVQARLWVNNRSGYNIKFIAETTIGDEVIDIRAGYANFLKDAKYAFAFYKKYKIFIKNSDGSEKLVLEKDVSEGGNRFIEVGRTRSGNVYIAKDYLELSPVHTWGYQILYP